MSIERANQQHHCWDDEAQFLSRTSIFIG